MITLAQIGAFLLRIIGIITGINTIVSIIQGDTSQLQTKPGILEADLDAVLGELADPTVGLSAIISHLNILQGDVSTILTDVVAIHSDYQQRGQSVTLPPSPPPVYTTPTTSDIWQSIIAVIGGRNIGAAEVMTNMWLMSHNWGNVWRFPFNDAPYFTLIGQGELQDLTPFNFSSPRPSLSNVRRSDTVLSWCQREASFFSWSTNIGGEVFAIDSRLAVPVTWFCIFTNATLFEAAFGSVVPASNAPVWPGSSSVTLGTPVALSPTTVVTGPMHGVIIDITGFAPRQEFGLFGTVQGLRFTGALTFIDDDGEAERPQALGANHEVLLPKSMAIAQSCAIRADVAVTGTATPFTIP